MLTRRKILFLAKVAFTMVLLVSLKRRIPLSIDKKSEEIMSKMRFEESELETLKRKNKDLEAENNNLHERLMKKEASESKMLGDRNDGIPLSGGLRDPQPEIKVGHIDKGADLIFGIPTVKREGVSYLNQTLTSLFENLNKKSKFDVKFVVFVAESDKTILNQVISEVSKYFPAQIKNNLLQIISPSQNLYPNNWSHVISLPDHFGDPYERVKWRSKENLDMVHLLMYGYNLYSRYYVMMEDDVITQKDYVEDIMKFVEENKEKDYFYLSFCKAGSIGKLFRRKTLPKFASFIHMYYNKKPLDWLQYDFSTLDTCSYSEPCNNCRKRMKDKIIDRKPSLFQHMGRISSLKGKIQNFKDETFGKKNF